MRVLTAGVDEAGRGPLAGPVVAAAVVLDAARPISGLRDSKCLRASARRGLEALIRERALDFAIGRAEVEEIDRLNVLQATLLAMRRAVLALRVVPSKVIVDGLQRPELPGEVIAMVKADARVAEVSAASILAKESRDEEMRALDRRYPVYGFSRHKGYPTREHLEALAMHGACAVHRKTFAPVRRVLGRA